MSENPGLGFLLSFAEPSTSMFVVPQAVTSGDIFGDGNNRIIFVTLEQKLVCFDGSRMTHEIVLPDFPSSICIHHNGKTSSTLPLVCVGAGSSVFFYLNLRQFAKFDLPLPFRSDEEKSLYLRLSQENTLTCLDLQNELKQLKSQNKPLSPPSISLLSADLTDPTVFHRFDKLVHEAENNDCVTCLAVIKSNAVPEDLSTKLFVGTESNQLFLLNNNNQEIEKKWELGAPPSTIRTSGFLSGSSTVAIICRDRFLRIISNLSNQILQVSCESLPVDVAVAGGNIYVALMSKNIRIFDSSSKMIGSISFDQHIVSLASVELLDRQISLCCVALIDGNVFFLERGVLYSSHQFENGISSVTFGKIGREPFNLLIFSNDGGIYLRSLSRLASKKKDKKRQPTSVQPIPVPRNSKLYLNQVNYEKEHSVEMFDAFTNSLRYLHMLTLSTYSDIIQDSAISPIEDITFSFTVAGMGPTFVVDLLATNTGNNPLLDVIVFPKYQKDLFYVEPSSLNLPNLLGGSKTSGRFEVRCLDREGKTGPVTIFAVSPLFSSPLCSSVVQIPVSQFPID